MLPPFFQRIRCNRWMDGRFFHFLAPSFIHRLYRIIWRLRVFVHFYNFFQILFCRFPNRITPEATRANIVAVTITAATEVPQKIFEKLKIFDQENRKMRPEGAFFDSLDQKFSTFQNVFFLTSFIKFSKSEKCTIIF